MHPSVLTFPFSPFSFLPCSALSLPVFSQFRLSPPLLPAVFRFEWLMCSGVWVEYSMLVLVMFFQGADRLTFRRIPGSLCSRPSLYGHLPVLGFFCGWGNHSVQWCPTLKLLSFLLWALVASYIGNALSASLPLAGGPFALGHPQPVHFGYLGPAGFSSTFLGRTRFPLVDLRLSSIPKTQFLAACPSS